MNVNNVGSHNRLIPVLVEPDGITWAAMRIKPVQQWTWTNTIAF